MPREINFHGSFRFRWLPETHFQAELPENCVFQNRAPVLSQLTGAHNGLLNKSSSGLATDHRAEELPWFWPLGIRFER